MCCNFEILSSPPIKHNHKAAVACLAGGCSVMLPQSEGAALKKKKGGGKTERLTAVVLWLIIIVGDITVSQQGKNLIGVHVLTKVLDGFFYYVTYI